MGNVILHAFNWTFQEIGAAAKEIRDLGYNGVLVSPVAYSRGNAWYDRYQPIDYRIVLSPLGALTDLKSMIAELKKNQLKVFVDVVFNHMAHRADENLTFPGDDLLSEYKTDARFRENCIFGTLDENLFTEDDFNPKQCIDTADYSNPHKMEDVHNDRICDARAPAGLPDLNGQSPHVIEAQQQTLRALKALGIDGVRIDAAKHMPIEHIQSVFTPDITKDLYVFGEIIPADHGQFLKDFLQGVNFSAYDFPLFYAIHEALGPEGSLESLSAPNGLDAFRSLTFSITHDIPNNEAMRSFIFDITDEQRTDENMAYACILGRDGGIPMVYSDKGEDDGAYTNLWKNAYKKQVIQKMISFHNALFGKKMDILSSGKCHTVFSRERQGIVAINKCHEPIDLTLPANGIQGEFTDLISDESILVKGADFKLSIPPRTYRLYLKRDASDG